MEQIRKLGTKNVYITLAIAAIGFTGLWVYEKAIKPLFIRRQVTKLIDQLQQEEEISKR